MQNKQKLLSNDMGKKTVKGGAPKRQEFYYEKVARENARQFIDDSSLSQRAVAKELGMNHYQELNNMLRGATTILNQIPALARVLNKSECDFFKESKDANSKITKHNALLSMVIEVMESPYKNTQKALTQNIEEFVEKVREKKEADTKQTETDAIISRLEKEIEELKQEKQSDFKTKPRTRRGSTT